MKTAGLHLVLFVLAGPLAAQPAPPAPAAAKTSARLKQEIRVFLPKYAPPPPPPANPFTAAATEEDPNVLQLPTFSVKEYRPRDHDPDVWLTDKSIQRKAMAAYRQSLSDFEWALNSWHIPLFGSSPTARARAAYTAGKSLEESRRIRDLFKLASAADSVELEKERVKMEQTQYWQSRPAGHGRAK